MRGHEKGRPEAALSEAIRSAADQPQPVLLPQLEHV
jgi:hypothetical protein